MRVKADAGRNRDDSGVSCHALHEKQLVKNLTDYALLCWEIVNIKLDVQHDVALRTHEVC